MLSSVQSTILQLYSFPSSAFRVILCIGIPSQIAWGGSFSGTQESVLEGERAAQAAAVEAAVVDSRLAAAGAQLLARLRAEEAASQASWAALQKRLVSCQVPPPSSSSPPLLRTYLPVRCRLA